MSFKIKSIIALLLSMLMPNLQSMGLIFDEIPASCTSCYNKIFCDLLAQQAFAEFKHNNLYLFDGITGDRQCHLQALQTILIPSAELEDLTYLTLSLLLSSSFFTNKNLLYKRIISSDKILRDQHITQRAEQRKFKTEFLQFLQNKNLLDQAKRSLNRILMARAQECVNASDNQDFINEVNLLLSYNLSHQIREEFSLPILPKLVGVELVLQYAIKHQIKFIFKIKHVCTHGVHYSILLSQGPDWSIATIDESQELEQTLPVIVIEGINISTKSIQSFPDFVSHRDNCGNCLFNNFYNCKHEPCLACCEHDDPECPEFIENIAKICRLDSLTIQRCVAADFMDTLQPQLAAMLTSPDFPILSDIFMTSLIQAQTDGMSQNNISTFYIEHMYADTFGHALTSPRLIG